MNWKENNFCRNLLTNNPSIRIWLQVMDEEIILFVQCLMCQELRGTVRQWLGIDAEQVQLQAAESAVI